MHPNHNPPPQPLSYPRYTNSSSSSLPQQLHGWLKGLTATAVTAVAATAGGSADGGVAGTTMSSAQLQQQQQQQAATVSCLATGNNWSEVVQVRMDCQQPDIGACMQA